MAAKDRRKAPGRIAILAATGLASATFLFAIVNAPTASQAALQSASVAQVSSATTQPVSSSTALTSTSTTQTSTAQTSSTQSTTSTARFRTRAS